MSITLATRLVQARNEYSRIDPSFTVAVNLLEKEIIRLERLLGMTNPPTPTGVRQTRIPVPVAEYPGYNFLGRIVGPRGTTVKYMEKESGCSIRVRGKGAQRPGQKEPVDTMHVLVTFAGPPELAEDAISHAERLVNAVMVPPANDMDDKFKLAQLKALAIYNGQFDRTKIALSSWPNPRVEAFTSSAGP